MCYYSENHSMSCQSTFCSFPSILSDVEMKNWFRPWHIFFHAFGNGRQKIIWVKCCKVHSINSLIFLCGTQQLTLCFMLCWCVKYAIMKISFEFPHWKLPVTFTVLSLFLIKILSSAILLASRPVYTQHDTPEEFLIIWCITDFSNC